MEAFSTTQWPPPEKVVKVVMTPLEAHNVLCGFQAMLDHVDGDDHYFDGARKLVNTLLELDPGWGLMHEDRA